jgi:NAD(P)-dependent dehydrogenase (short-subunit alcohol dehydrogenase family)
MSQTIDLTGKVAIVTGAGGGLGRSHALLLASRGAKVVVNDLGGDVAGKGQSSAAARSVVAEIKEMGGDAVANGASVADEDAVNLMVAETIDRWGAIDILVNNAGILRDKSFGKMDLADFRAVLEVHLMGAVICTKSVWSHMRDRNYGRIVFTTSSSGLYGNFGQANYGAAKMALVGLMQTLAIEGAKFNIRVNCLAPSAATRMMEGIVPPEILSALTPDSVSPAVLALAAENAPTRAIICAGGGSFEQAHITMTQGIHLGVGRDDVADELLQRLDETASLEGIIIPATGFEQFKLELAKAGYTQDKENVA